MFTTGNSETTTATGGFKASRKTGNNKLALEGSGAYARSGLRVINDNNGNGMIDNPSEIQTVEHGHRRDAREQASLRPLPHRVQLAVHRRRSRAATSRPARSVVFGGQAGYSRQLYKSKTAEAVGEFGYDYSHEDLVAGAAHLDPLGARVRRATRRR